MRSGDGPQDRKARRAIEVPSFWRQRRPPVPTIVFDTFWRFAVERQSMYFRRMSGGPEPWTDDEVLRRYRFTNAYRASDRTSQYLIRSVIYDGPDAPSEVVFRTVLFRLFNLPSTWEALTGAVGPLRAADFNASDYGQVLGKHAQRGERLYSAAYVIPPVSEFGTEKRKHEQHLQLVRRMLDDELGARVHESRSLQDLFDLISSYPGLGTFLAFQLAIDLNYSTVVQFSEMDFVVAGPGASEGIRKCFTSRDEWTDAAIIGWVTERQNVELERRDLEFRSLWGRPLQLIDIQNLFCEIAKYSRVAHPEFTLRGGRTRIKRTFEPGAPVRTPWFPPKWGINDRIRSTPGTRLEQLDLAFDEVEPKTAAPIGPDVSPKPIRLENGLFPLGR
jgi:hypothetical protein